MVLPTPPTTQTTQRIPPPLFSFLPFPSDLRFRSTAKFAAILSLFVSPLMARADLLFEGYSKVMLGDVHIGYAVQRYEFDPKKQEFTAISLLRTNQRGGNITESLKARSNAAFKPLGFQYTSLVGGAGKTIDASFKNDQMTATVREKGKPGTISKKIPKGAFLSSFLAYLMLQGKEGIKTGVKYGYQAIAEEDAVIYSGEAYVAGEETFAGLSTFKVLNTFKGAQFISFVTHKGEIIGTKSPVQRISTELVPSMKEATAGQPFNASTLTTLFGAIPAGSENAIARKPKVADAPGTTVAPTNVTPKGSTASPDKQHVLQTTPSSSPESPKKDGVAPGQGLILKGTPVDNPEESDSKK